MPQKMTEVALEDLIPYMDDGDVTEDWVKKYFRKVDTPAEETGEPHDSYYYVYTFFKDKYKDLSLICAEPFNKVTLFPYDKPFTDRGVIKTLMSIMKEDEE